MEKTFTVVACNKNSKGGFVWKLVVEDGVAEIFGVKKALKSTYYIGGMPAEAKIGDVFKEDMEKFEVVERDFELDDKQVIKLKWLHVKRS